MERRKARRAVGERPWENLPADSMEREVWAALHGIVENAATAVAHADTPTVVKQHAATARRHARTLMRYAGVRVDDGMGRASLAAILGAPPKGGS